VALEVARGAGRKHGAAVAGALAAADEDLVAAEVDVLNAQPATLQQAEAGAVQQRGHQRGGAVDARENGAHFLTREHDGDVQGALGAHDLGQPRKIDLEHVAIQEQERRERLVLRGGRDAAIDGERREEPGDFDRAQLDGMAAAAVHDEPADPAGVRVFGAWTEVARAQRGAHAVHELGRARLRCGRGHGRIESLRRPGVDGVGAEPELLAVNRSRPSSRCRASYVEVRPARGTSGPSGGLLLIRKGLTKRGRIPSWRGV
jgi:hypothetical protein